MSAWNPEHGRAYQERKRLGIRSTYWNRLTWAERFERKIQRGATADDCWLWQGAKDPRGYGIAQVGSGHSTTAHRDAYIHLVGPVPADLEVDHRCRVRACVNPSHLRLLTHAENSRLADHWWGRKTHCIRGHEFTPENTAPRSGRAGRSCRACARARQAEYRSRRTAA